MAIGSQAKDPATLEGREGIGVLPLTGSGPGQVWVSGCGVFCWDIGSDLLSCFISYFLMFYHILSCFIIFYHVLSYFIISYPCKSTSFEQFLNYDRSCCDLSRQSLRPCHPSWFGTPLDFNPCSHELSRVNCNPELCLRALLKNLVRLGKIDLVWFSAEVWMGFTSFSF